LDLHLAVQSVTIAAEVVSLIHDRTWRGVLDTPLCV